jgi:hypothetical protein
MNLAEITAKISNAMTGPCSGITATAWEKEIEGGKTLRRVYLTAGSKKRGHVALLDDGRIVNEADAALLKRTINQSLGL